MMFITSLIGYLGAVLGFCFLTLAIGELLPGCGLRVDG